MPNESIKKLKKKKKTSMMRPSQNFLLYNGTVVKIEVNEWINNFKKNVTSVPLPLGIHSTIIAIIPIVQTITI